MRWEGRWWERGGKSECCRGGVQIKLLQCGMLDKNAKLSFFNLPSLEKLPDINQSLKMINTFNAFPNHPSYDNVDLPLPSPEDDSLADRISPSAKKRKIGCTCKKTFCLKMYCECFAGGRQCGDDCACSNCKNAPGFEQAISSAKMGVKEGGSRNCSLAEKRCNCKKSHCLKRYCECYNAGVGCSEGCKCEGCQNKGLQANKKEEEQEPEQPEVIHALSEQQHHLQQVEGQGEQKTILQQCFPSMNGFRSMEDLSRFYN